MYSMDDDIDSQVEEFDSTSSSSSSSSSSSESSSGGEGESSCDAGESEVNESQEDEGQPSSSKSYSSLAAGKRRKRYRKRKVPGLRKKLRTHLDSIDELNPEALNAQSAELERIRRLRLQQSVLGVPEHSANSSGSQNRGTGFFSKSHTQSSIASGSGVVGGSALNRESSSPELVVIHAEKTKKDRVAEINAIVIDSESDSDSTKPITVSHAKTENRPHQTSSTNETTKQQTKVLHNKYDVYEPRSDGRILVNVGHPPDEEDIFLAPQIAQVVKPHQVGGVRFLYDNIIESISRFGKSPGFGCILAHSMGLGKTLQVISFIELMFRCTPTRHVLCVVPVNTLQNWISEFDRWIPPLEKIRANTSQAEIAPRTFKLCVLSEVARTLDARLHIIKGWQTSGGVLLIGYEMFRLLSLSIPSLGGNKMATKKRKNIVMQPLPSGGTIDLEETEKEMEALIEIQQALCCPGPDLVVCDEGHRIKNDYSNISQSLKKISTRRRIVMTGYPLQNNLTEYWCMVDFVRPKYLGTKQEFADLFERPITNGQCVDSTPVDVRLMRYRSHVLHKLLEGFVLRRGHEILRETLPPKFEHVLFIRPSNVQAVLYDYNMSLIENSTGASATAGPLKAFAVCSKIWNHPDVYFHEASAQNSKRESPVSWLTEAGLPKSLLSKGSDPTSVCKIEWPSTQLPTYSPGLLQNSPKMTILMELIDRSVQQGDKVLVFSQTLSTLTYVEKLLSQRLIPIPLSMDQNGAVQYSNYKWTKTKNYYRLDGSTNSLERDKLINYFNSSQNQDCWVFLLSTKAGCLGINLIGANRVVVLDVSWNPCYDAQAVCRVYRYGQKKPCYIYRLVCDGTMERKIYDRQISKQGMSDRVVDELHPERHLTSQDILNLIAPLAPLPTPRDMNLFANEYLFDPLLMEICKSYGQLLTKPPFKHESLLVDSEEDRMTDVEKIIAVKSFQQQLSAMKSTPAPGQAYKSHVQVQRPPQIPHASSAAASSSSVPPAAQVTRQHTSRPQPAFTPTVMRRITPVISGPSSSTKKEVEVICLDSDDEVDSVPMIGDSTPSSVGTSCPLPSLAQTTTSSQLSFAYGNTQGSVQHTLNHPGVSQQHEQFVNSLSQGVNPLISSGNGGQVNSQSTELPDSQNLLQQQQSATPQTVSQSVGLVSSVPLSSCSTLQLNSSYNNSISAVASFLLAAQKQGVKLPMYSNIDRLVAAAKFLCESNKNLNQSNTLSQSGESQSSAQVNAAEYVNTLSTQMQRSTTDANHFTISLPSSQQLQVTSHFTSPTLHVPLRPTPSTQASSTTGSSSLASLLSKPVLTLDTNTSQQSHQDLLSPLSTRSTTPSPIRTPSPFSPPKQDTSVTGQSICGDTLSSHSLSHSNSSSHQNRLSPMNPPSHTPVHSPSKSFSPPSTTCQAVSPKSTRSPSSRSTSKSPKLAQTCARKLQKPNTSPKLHSPKQHGKSPAKLPSPAQVPPLSTTSPVQSHSDTVSSQSSSFTNQKRRISSDTSVQTSSRQSGRNTPHSFSPSPVSTPTSYTPSSIPLLSPVAARLLWLSTGTQLPSSPPEDVAKLPPLSSPTPIPSPRTMPQQVETVKKDHSHHSVKESSMSPLCAKSVDSFRSGTSSHGSSLESSTSFCSSVGHSQSKTSTSSSTVFQSSAGPIRMCSPVPYSNTPSSSLCATKPSDSLPKMTDIEPMMGSSLPLSSKSMSSKRLLPLSTTCSTFSIGQLASQGSSVITSNNTNNVDTMIGSKRMRPSCISIPKSDESLIRSSLRSVTGGGGGAVVLTTTSSHVTEPLQRKALSSLFHQDPPKTQPITNLPSHNTSLSSSDNISTTTSKTSHSSQAQRVSIYSLSSSSSVKEPTHSVVSTGTQSTIQSLTMAGELQIVSAENPLLNNFNTQSDRTVPVMKHLNKAKCTSPISFAHQSQAPVYKSSSQVQIQSSFSNQLQRKSSSFTSRASKPGTSEKLQPQRILPSSTAVSSRPGTSEKQQPQRMLPSSAAVSSRPCTSEKQQPQRMLSSSTAVSSRPGTCTLEKQQPQRMLSSSTAVSSRPGTSEKQHPQRILPSSTAVSSRPGTSEKQQPQRMLPSSAAVSSRPCTSEKQQPQRILPSSTAVSSRPGTSEKQHPQRILPSSTAVSSRPCTSEKQQPQRILPPVAVYRSIPPVTTEPISPRLTTPPLRSLSTMNTTPAQYNSSSQQTFVSKLSSHSFQPTTQSLPLPVQNSVVHTHKYTEAAPANNNCPLPTIINRKKYRTSQPVVTGEKMSTQNESRTKSSLSSPHGYTSSIVTQLRNSEYSARACTQNTVSTNRTKPIGSETGATTESRTKGVPFPQLTVYQRNQLHQIARQQQQQQQREGYVGKQLQEVNQFGSTVTSSGGGGLNHSGSRSTGGHSSSQNAHVGMTKLYHPTNNVVLN